MADAKSKAVATVEEPPADPPPNLDFPDDVSPWGVFRDKTILWASHVPVPFSNGGTDYEKGWLVRDQEGNDSVVSDEEFSLKYTEIPPAKWDEELSRTAPLKKGAEPKS